MVTTTEKPGAATPESAGSPFDQSVGVVEPIILKLPADWRLTDEALWELCELNQVLPFERTAEGDLVIVPPAHGRSPEHGVEIAFQIRLWMRDVGSGVVRDASGGYKLGEIPPPGEEEKQTTLVPDVSWMPMEMVDGLDPEMYEDGIPVVCPPFVVEIISAKQRVAPQQRKMQEWIEFGVRLGWLIDPRREKVLIYRPGEQEPQELDKPESLSGEDVLEGFILDCAPIWS